MHGMNSSQEWCRCGENLKKGGRQNGNIHIAGNNKRSFKRHYKVLYCSFQNLVDQESFSIKRYFHLNMTVVNTPENLVVNLLGNMEML